MKMKIKIPEITNYQERMLKKGKAVQLIKVPKGKRIFWYKDGKHYKLVAQNKDSSTQIPA
jgi:hypothetical protein